MTPLTLNEIRATIIDATDDMTAALLRDLDWMIEAGCEVRPPPTPCYVVFDGPPSHESGRFVEVETPGGWSLDMPTAQWEPHPTAPGLWRLGPFEDLEVNEVLR